jgi:hypothetical protein
MHCQLAAGAWACKWKSDKRGRGSFPHSRCKADKSSAKRNQTTTTTATRTTAELWSYFLGAPGAVGPFSIEDSGVVVRAPGWFAPFCFCKTPAISIALLDFSGGAAEGID